MKRTIALLVGALILFGSGVRMQSAPFSFADAAQQSANPVHEALLCGGTNLVFGWYDTDHPNLTRFDGWLPAIHAAGACHVRLVISMDMVEDGTTGTVRQDRYDALLRFMALARENGLLTFVDIHNTGMRECSGCDWSDNYMWGIYSSASIRDRHTRLLVDLMTRLARDVDKNTWVLGTANEPIAQSGWYEYQAQLVERLQAACADCYFTVMAHDWQGIEATIWFLRPFADSTHLIYDVHFYEPLSLTHCSYPGQPNRCSGLQYPGTFSTWRGTQYWDSERIDDLIAPIAEWRDRNGVFVHMSEFGTAAALADDVRSRYLGDVVTLLRRYGIGFTQFEWGQNFGIVNHPLSLQAVFGQGQPVATVPPNAERTEVPEPTATRTPRATASPLTCAIATTHAGICVVETRPTNGNTRSFRIETNITPVYRIAITVGGAWRADDETAPYDFTLTVEPGARVSALVYFNARDNYVHGDWTFEDGATATPTGTPTASLTAMPTTLLTPTPSTTATAAVTAIPDTAMTEADVRRIVREELRALLARLVGDDQ